MLKKNLIHYLLIIFSFLAIGTLAQANSAEEDNLITTKVVTQLAENPALKGSDILVKTNNGVVNLSGVVRNEKQQDIAVSTARKVDDVKEVTVHDLKIEKQR